jgi:hypothetical protein
LVRKIGCFSCVWIFVKSPKLNLETGSLQAIKFRAEKQPIFVFSFHQKCKSYPYGEEEKCA